jgi:signal transduction histidine kinase
MVATVTPTSGATLDHAPDLRLVALGFQSLTTLILGLVHLGLWRQRREPYHLSWALAWTLYAVRLVFISAYVVHRADLWLFLHQSVTGASALLLLFAATQFATGARWRRRYLALGAVVVGWAAIAAFVIHDMAVAGITSTVLLTGVTIATAVVFWRRLRARPSFGTRMLAWAFTLWALHHLDYPILRAQGAGLYYGVFMDVLFILVIAIGTLTLVLGEQRDALARRTAQLEQLTGQLLRAQEEERRRVARELHDEAGQLLTVVKMTLEREGRMAEGELVGRALHQVRDLSRRLRPAVLDRLGLEAAIGSLADECGRAGVRVEVEWALPARRLDDALESTLYRVVQEALTNVLRHAAARHARVRVEAAPLRLTIEDDGRGAGEALEPNMGLLGMRERVAELGGTLTLDGSPLGGLRVQARFPEDAGEDG